MVQGREGANEGERRVRGRRRGPHVDHPGREEEEPERAGRKRKPVVLDPCGGGGKGGGAARPFVRGTLVRTDEGGMTGVCACVR